MKVFVFWGLAAFVGLVQGLAYVNTIYLLLKDPLIEKSEKELTLNINTVFTDLATMFTSIAGYIFSIIIKNE